MILAIEITYPPVPSVVGISPHGVLAAVGVAVSFILLGREIRRRHLPQPILDRAVSSGVLAGILGARVYYVLTHLDQ